MDLQLTGKVAVITGSGRGIGYASALALAREGARIVITDIDPDSVRQAVAGLKEAGFEAIGTVLDVCDDGQVRAMADEARLRRHRHPGQQRRLHPRQVPAQDAGSGLGRRGRHHPERRLPLHPGGPALHDGKKVGPRDQHRLARALGQPRPDQLLCRQGRPDRLHRALALEQGKFNITANAIAPGLIETPLVRGLSTYDMLRANALARQPVQRLGAVEDIADAVAFLASERASFITGELLHVTGGRYAS